MLDDSITDGDHAPYTRTHTRARTHTQGENFTTADAEGGASHFELSAAVRDSSGSGHELSAAADRIEAESEGARVEGAEARAAGDI